MAKVGVVAQLFAPFPFPFAACDPVPVQLFISDEVEPVDPSDLVEGGGVSIELNALACECRSSRNWAENED